MGGGLAVFLPCYLLIIKPRSKPILAEEFTMPVRKRVDARLLSGAAIFGIGWGLVGLCPGPVVSSLAIGNAGTVLFFASMMVGLGSANILIHINKKRQVAPETAIEN
jgi:uncharacterized membrane protein YedE/YeeE